MVCLDIGFSLWHTYDMNLGNSNSKKGAIINESREINDKIHEYANTLAMNAKSLPKSIEGVWLDKSDMYGDDDVVGYGWRLSEILYRLCESIDASFIEIMQTFLIVTLRSSYRDEDADRVMEIANQIAEYTSKKLERLKEECLPVGANIAAEELQKGFEEFVRSKFKEEGKVIPEGVKIPLWNPA
jgi:hypothetical protein